jgi:hypothetical protein
MKTRALLLALPLLAVASCRDNRSSVTIQQACFPTDDCTFSDKCDKVVSGAMILDATGPCWLRTHLQVANQLADNSSADLQRTNPNGAHVDQVAVEYSGVGLPKDVYDTNSFVPAGGTAVVLVDAIRPLGTNPATLLAYAQSVQGAQLIANVRLRGYYDDGSRFETGEFPIATYVCAGCVTACAAGTLACPVEGMDPATCVTTK